MTVDGETMNTQYMNRRLVLSISLLLAPFLSAAQEVATDKALATVATQIESLAVPQAEAELLSGIILVARGNQILFQRAYGFANWELWVPNKP